MDRLPALGSLRSIASAYEEDDVSDEEKLTKSAKKRKLSTEEDEKVETKDENSDYDIVVSDEEGNSSGTGSVKNAVVIKQPRVATASRLVSYGGDEDEEEDASKVKGNEIPQNDGEASMSAEVHAQETEEATPLDQGESSTNAESQPTAQETKNTEQENENMKAMPKELVDHLTAVKSIQVTLPEEPDGRCSNSLQEKIENLLETKKRTGRDLKHTIQRKKNFRNPSIYEKLVAFCSINEIGTNYPEHIYDPFSWTEDSFYEKLSKIQKEHHEKKQKERSKVEFVSATKKTTSTASTSGEDAARRRRSKWDVTSTGTAALTIPPSAIQTIASFQAVVAAASSQVKRA